MLTLTRAQVRAVELLAIQELGIPGIVLMENAARHVADAVGELLRDDLDLPCREAELAVICGGGNNGGDGLAAARHLHNHGARVAVFLARPPEDFKGDAATNFQIARNMGLEVVPILDAQAIEQVLPRWQKAHVLVDALLGTGFSGQVRGNLAPVIAQINAVRDGGVKVVAVDVPSGLDCDTGTPSNATVKADVTVTFVAVKPGLAAPGAGAYVGELVVAEIGVPPEIVERVRAESGRNEPRP